MKRGDLVTVAMSGDIGKPRPAVIVQSDQFDATGTVTVLLVSSTLFDAPLIRLTVKPSPANGLERVSQIMVDKAMTVRREKLGEPFGRVDGETMIAVNRSLALFLGFAQPRSLGLRHLSFTVSIATKVDVCVTWGRADIRSPSTRR